LVEAIQAQNATLTQLVKHLVISPPSEGSASRENHGIYSSLLLNLKTKKYKLLNHIRNNWKTFLNLKNYMETVKARILIKILLTSFEFNCS
jgi:hypothetical protein